MTMNAHITSLRVVMRLITCTCVHLFCNFDIPIHDHDTLFMPEVSLKVLNIVGVVSNNNIVFLGCILGHPPKPRVYNTMIYVGRGWKWTNIGYKLLLLFWLYTV